MCVRLQFTFPYINLRWFRKKNGWLNGLGVDSYMWTVWTVIALQLLVKVFVWFIYSYLYISKPNGLCQWLNFYLIWFDLFSFNVLITELECDFQRKEKSNNSCSFNNVVIIDLVEKLDEKQRNRWNVSMTLASNGFCADFERCTEFFHEFYF